MPGRMEYREGYAEMSDNEMLTVASDVGSLEYEARIAVESELHRRGLSENDVAQYRRDVAKFRAEDFWGKDKAEVLQEHSPANAAASRWAPLGIFLCVALASAILAAVVLVKGSPTFVEGLTEKLTKASLQLGLASWGVSEAIAGRWLTLKRTWIAAIALYGVAFILIAVY